MENEYIHILTKTNTLDGSHTHKPYTPYKVCIYIYYFLLIKQYMYMEKEYMYIY